MILRLVSSFLAYIVRTSVPLFLNRDLKINMRSISSFLKMPHANMRAINPKNGSSVSRTPLFQFLKLFIKQPFSFTQEGSLHDILKALWYFVLKDDGAKVGTQRQFLIFPPCQFLSTCRGLCILCCVEQQWSSAQTVSLTTL